jgi:hypothetical protein
MLTPAAAGAQYADSGSITMTSDPGDWVGGGRSYSYSTSGGLIQTQVDNQDSHLRVYYDDGNDPGGTFWYFDLAAPAGQALGVGVYTATEYPNQAPTEAGLHVHGWVLGSGHDCSTLTATFTISTWRLGPAGYFGYGLDYLQDFDATFEQHCEGAAAALRGTIHLANQPAPPMTVDLSTTQPGPMVPKDTLSFQTVLKPGDIDGDLVLNEDGRLVGAPSTTYAGTIVPYAATQGLHTYTAVFTPRNTNYPSVTSAPVTLLVLSSTPTLTLCSSPPNASGSVTLTTSGSPSTAGTVHFFKGTVDLGPADTTSGEVSTKTVQLGTAQSPQQLAAVFVAPDGTASATSGELDYTGQSQCGDPGPDE